MNNLALAVSDQGTYEAAEEIHQRVLGLEEKTLGPEHPNMLGNMSNLTLVFLKQGKYEAAEEMH
jgi:hypothetical protein